MNKIFLILFFLQFSEIDKYIKQENWDKAEKVIEEYIKKEEPNERIEFLYIYVKYKKKKYDEVLNFGNNFVKKYPESKYKQDILYLIAKSYENKKFYSRAFETYSLLLKEEEPKYYKESKEKVLKYARKISLKLLMKELKGFLGTAIYKDLLEMAFKRARKEGDLKAQEELYNLLALYFPESELKKEAEKVFKEEKKSFFPFFYTKSKDILIFAPLSGQDSLYGEEFLRGFRIGAGPYYNEVKIFDTGSDPIVFFRIFKNIKDKRFLLGIGPLLLKNVYTSLPLFSLSRDKIFIVPSISYIRAGDFSDNIFSFSYTLREELEAIVERFILPNNFDSILVLIPETYEGESIFSFLKEKFKPYRNVNSIFLTFNPDSFDFQSELDSFVKFFKDTLGGDLIIFPSGTDESLLSLASQVVFKGLKSGIITTGRFLREDFAIKSNRYVEDRVYFAGFTVWDESIREIFVDRYIKEYHAKPGEIADIGYDLGVIVRFIMDKKIENPGVLVSFLRNIKIFKGAGGVYVFDKESDDLVKFYFIKDKRFEEIQ